MSGLPFNIWQYPNKATLNGAELLEIWDVAAGVTYNALASAIAACFNGTKQAAIASAATTSIGTALGIRVHITGTTTITSLGSAADGTLRIVIFDGALTLTHHSTNLVLPGSANITTVAGDAAIFECEGDGAGGAGSRWKCVVYQKSDGTSIKAAALARTDKSADYTFVLADANTGFRHPSADTTARTWTIPANSSVAFPIFTVITIVNQNAAGIINLTITSDTLRWSPTGGAGSRALAANGIATLIKVDTTEWLLSGTGIT